MRAGEFITCNVNTHTFSQFDLCKSARKKLHSLFVTGLDVQILFGVVCSINVSTQLLREQSGDMTDTVSQVSNHCYRRPTLYKGMVCVCLLDSCG